MMLSKTADIHSRLQRDGEEKPSGHLREKRKEVEQKLFQSREIEAVKIPHNTNVVYQARNIPKRSLKAHIFEWETNRGSIGKEITAEKYTQYAETKLQ